LRRIWVTLRNFIDLIICCQPKFIWAHVFRNKMEDQISEIVFNIQYLWIINFKFTIIYEGIIIILMTLKLNFKVCFFFVFFPAHIHSVQNRSDVLFVINRKSRKIEFSNISLSIFDIESYDNFWLSKAKNNCFIQALW